jgi:hypothetical protein
MTLVEEAEIFRSLNPVVAEMAMPRLRRLADDAPAEQWEAFRELAEEVVAAYLNSPVKRGEADVVTDYNAIVDQTASADNVPEEAAPPAPDSLALVPRGRYDARQWTRLQATADVPEQLEAAVHAARKRNRLVDTVLEPIFELALRCHRDAAIDWQLAIATNEEGCDPDVARDLLRAWQTLGDYGEPLLRQSLRWAGDNAVYRNWRPVSIEADRFLRHYALRSWLERQTEKTAIIEHVKRVPDLDHAPRLVCWYQELLDQLGRTTAFFISQANAWNTDHQAWHRAALVRELNRLRHLAEPLLLLADLYFAEPDGGWRFAMALFGFSDSQRGHWERCLESNARTAVNRRFLSDLRLGRKPAATIEQLCFGDTGRADLLKSELDLLSGEFDSLGQRDKVVSALAPIYASYRDRPLRATEISRRYRSMMRLLHPDSLNNLVPEDAHDVVEQADAAITTLRTLATASRKFLTARESSDPEIEKLVADDQVYVETIREHRNSAIAKLL